jgi:hypothetical protein
MSDKRFYATLLFSNAAKKSVWAGGFFSRAARPTRAELFELFKSDAAAAFTRRGDEDAVPVELSIANLFEMPEPPHPAADDHRPLQRWRVTVDFVCHDVKFGSTSSGVFEWPEEPAGAALDAMTRVLLAESLSMRGDGPDYADYSDVLKRSVEPAADGPNHLRA